MATVDSDELDRLLARINAAGGALAASPTAGGAGTTDGDGPITVEIVVESEGRADSWFVQVDEHGGRAARGPAVEPTVVVRIDAATFAELRSGTLEMQRAIDGGRLTARGDLGALARARPALRALAGALAAAATTD